MSIISDALKKVQEVRRAATETPETPPPPLPRQAPPASPVESFQSRSAGMIEEEYVEKGRPAHSPRLWAIAGIAALAMTVLVSASIFFVSQASRPRPAPVTAPPSAAPYEGTAPAARVTPRPVPAHQEPAPVAAAPAPGDFVESTVRLPQPALTLNGIMVSPRSRYAIINDTMMMEGEMILGAMVEKIEPDAVVVQYKGAEFTLRLKKR